MILCEDFFVWDLKRVRRQANFLCVLRILKLKKKNPPKEINFKITTSKRKQGNKK